jgi:hypothetical protein
MYIYMIYILPIQKKTEAQESLYIIRLSFAHCANESLLFIRFEETPGSYPFANVLNGLAHLCLLL